MPQQIVNIISLIISAFLAFILSLTDLVYYSPQILALVVILILLSLKFFPRLFILLSSFFICFLVFSTTGLSSPFFFLVYFLLFTIASQNPPSTTLAFSLSLVILLSQSLDSLPSLISLLSLLLVTPLAWFIGKQYLDNLQLTTSLSQDETNIFYWHSLKFKTGISTIIDLASQLLSTPLLPTQKDHTKKIKDSAKSLLSSSQKLLSEIDRQSDEN